MKFINRLVITLTFAAAVSSCAETKDGDYNLIERASIDEWVKLNAPKLGLNYSKFGDGMYIQYAQAPAGAEQISDGDWLYLDYVGYDLNSNIYANRYEANAHILGLYNPKIYYAPQLVRVGKTGGAITEGQYNALVTMKVGQEVDLLMPSNMAYGSSGSTFGNGYGGNATIGANKPCRVKMVARKRIADISAYEDKLVKDYAMANLGIKNENDTIAPSLYLQVVDSIPKSRPISVDSTFKFKYKGTFVDGFMFDTNIPELALAAWNQIVSGTLTYSPSSSLVDAFTRVAKSGKLTYGCKFQMVFSSTYGYGTTGQTGSTTATTIEAYKPLVFTVEIEQHKAGLKP